MYESPRTTLTILDKEAPILAKKLLLDFVHQRLQAIRIRSIDGASISLSTNTW